MASVIINLVRLRLIFLIISCFLITKPVLAGDPPTLISPSNNSNISSIPTFSWQSIPNIVEYNILIDDEPTVTSPYAKNPYYPTNPNYTPQTLDPGTYYWKVKTKDSSGIWSSWSDIWSFTFTSTSSTSSPTSSPSTSPPTPTPTSTPQLASSFSVSNVSTQINSDQSFNASVNLTLPNNKNSVYYLSGAFKKTDSTRYFGLTKINSNWVKYESSNYLNQYKITTDDNGSWTGTLEVKPDISDTDYKGSGDYIFKVGRYTSTGSGPTWTNNETALKINDVGTISDTPTSQPTIKKTTLNPSLPAATKSPIPKPGKLLKLSSGVASVAGASTYASFSATPSSQSARVEVKDERQINPIIWIGIIFIFAGFGLIGYIYFRKR